MQQAEVLDEALSRELERHPELAAAWLFGSEARGEARPDSDIDIGIVLRDRRLTALDAHPLLRRMAAELERFSEGRQIDIVLLEPQGPIFCHSVLSEGRLLCEPDPERRVDFESETYVHYFDFKPTYDLAMSQALDGLADALGAAR